MNPLALAWSNLAHQRVRTFVSLLGVGFAVLLVFMQLGFLGALSHTATLIYDQLAFDVIVVSRDYVSLNRPASFPRARLAQARAAAGVRDTWPVTTAIGRWRDPRPQYASAPPAWSILMLCVEPAGLDRLFARPVGTVFRDAEELRRDAALLAQLDTVLVDRSSRKEFGDPRLWRAVRFVELNDHRVEVVGDVKVGTGFGYNGLLLTSEETVRRTVGWPGDRITLGLVQLEPGADPARVAAELEGILPGDVRAVPRAQLLAGERRFWRTKTAIGQFFVAGVAIALAVGGIFVYQMMAADISKLLPEYATIRALGYPGRYLSRVVYAQGVLLALVGYLPGLLAAALCTEFARRRAGVPLGLTGGRSALVLVLTLLMCIASARLAVRNVRRADPADLF